ncbi:MAG: Ig-like domain-containing protein [Bacilli bacterium]|nr:Ig-like domain-containing protein [Bacilli bacterium]
MKKTKTLALLSSLALGMMLASCGGGTQPDAPKSSEEGTPSTSAAISSQQEKIKITAEGNKTTLIIGETVKLTSSVEGVTFASSDAKIVTVDPTTGVVTAVGAGSTTISATKDGYKKGTLSITVNRPAPSGKVEFEAADHYSADGWYATAFMGMEFGNGSATPVTTSEDGATSYIGSFGAGDKETLKFTSSKAGEAELVAYIGAQQTVTVSEAMTAKFNGADLTLSGEITVDGYSLTWAEISLGKVNLVAGENTLELTMVSGGLSLDYLNVYGPAETTVTTVAAPAKETIVVTNENRDNLSIEVGDTLQITSETTDLTYTVNDETVASVSETGLVTGLATGQVKITVRKDGMYSDRITINVTPKKAVGEIQVEAETGVTEDGAIKATAPWSMGGGTPASGTTISTWPAGETLTVTFEATEAKTMTLFMTGKPRMNSSYGYDDLDLSAAVSLKFNNADVSLTGKTLPAQPLSSGWGADYVQVELGTVNVTVGTNTIAMTAIEDGPELDYFSLKPIAA